MANHHVVVGGGPAGINAIETIREFDGGASRITLVSDEPAHARMALPYWLSNEIPREQTHIADKAYYERLGVEPRVGARVEAIDTAASELRLDDGSTLGFDKLLLATGSRPAALPVPGADLPGVQHLWTLAQTESALATVGSGSPRVVMVGSGFIGFIMLNAMHKRGWSLAVVEREPRILPRMLDAPAAAITSDWLREKGVGLHSGTTVKRIAANGSAKRVELESGAVLEAELVVIATGVTPNVELAQAAGLDASDQGIAVNDRMQTSAPSVFAAGDVARGPVFHGPEAIHAIQPTAVDHGRVAGANMAGQDVRYPGSLLMNILDVCGLQCACYGDWLHEGAEAMTIENRASGIYRKLLWSGDEITGAMFVGRPEDVGMLTDLGMIKGMVQTRTKLGPWKEFLRENPFDVRRAFIASGVADKLSRTTLLGRPARTRGHSHGNARVGPQAGPGHKSFVGI